MDSSLAIEATDLSKKYRLGTIGMTSLREDLNRWWTRKKQNSSTEENVKTAGIDQSRMINDSEFWALHDLNFQIPKGEVVGLIGANGSGKSTLLKILSRITEPTEGEVKIRGKVASLLEVGTGFHPELTGRENVYINGAILGMTRREVDAKFDEIVEFAGISDFIDTPIKRYSSGMKVRLGFAVAAHLDPEILIVDEVLAVGDASFQKKCIGKMQSISDSGRTIIFVSHQLPMIENLCSKCILLEKGRIIKFDETKKIITKYHSSVLKHNDSLLSERSDRKGNGIIRIMDYFLLDENHSIVNFINCGNRMFLIFKVKINELSSGTINLSVGINGSNGDRITQLNSKTTRDTINLDSSNSFISLEIYKMNLMPDNYSFNIYLTIDGNISDWIINAGEIKVVESDYYNSGVLPASNQGRLLMDYKYRVTSHL
jgi:lipopolysaccharide transport system ATP-binding protein